MIYTVSPIDGRKYFIMPLTMRRPTMHPDKCPINEIPGIIIYGIKFIQ
jgi:hypothetical protein